MIKKVLLMAVVIGISIFIARSLIEPSYATKISQGAREATVYRLSDKPIRFLIPAAKRTIRILTNFDLPPQSPEEGVPYVLRVRDEASNRDDTFALQAIEPLLPNGDKALHYIGEPTTPARTREILFQRLNDSPATIEVSLVSPKGGSASLQLFVLQERAPFVKYIFANRLSIQDENKLAEKYGPLDWEDLEPSMRKNLVSQTWTRLPASNATSRKIYQTASLESVERKKLGGEFLFKHQSLAYTIQGPQKVKLLAVNTPFQGNYRTLSEKGEEHQSSLALAADQARDISIDEGKTTLWVQAEKEGTIEVLVSNAEAAIPPARIIPKENGDFELKPTWVFERDAKALPAPATPVVFELDGHNKNELRVNARAVMSLNEQPSNLQMHWLIRNAKDKVIAEGQIDEAIVPATEDRIQEEPDKAPSNPVSFYIWPPSNGAKLELTASRPTNLGVASRGFPALEHEYLGPNLDPLPILKNEPREQPMWFRFWPTNEEILRQDGRLQHLKLAVRFEKPSEPEQIGEPESLQPSRTTPRRMVLIPPSPGFPLNERGMPMPRQLKKDATIAAALPLPEQGIWWPIAKSVSDKAMEVEIEADKLPNSSEEARVPLKLLYILDKQQIGTPLNISIDHAAPLRFTTYASRGMIALPALNPGKHRIRIDEVGAGRFFVDKPIKHTAMHRNFSAFEMVPGKRVDVPVKKLDLPRALGLVLYFDKPPGHPSLHVIIDNAHHPKVPKGQSRLSSRMKRTLTFASQPVPSGFFLDRNEKEVIWESRAIFVGLGDDLPAGTHNITLTLLNSDQPAYARFFAYNAAEKVEKITYSTKIGAMP